MTFCINQSPLPTYVAPFLRKKGVCLSRYALHPVWSPLHHRARKTITSTLGHINTLDSPRAPKGNTTTHSHIHTQTHKNTHTNTERGTRNARKGNQHAAFAGLKMPLMPTASNFYVIEKTHTTTHKQWRAREMPIRPDRLLLTTCDILQQPFIYSFL